MGWKQENQCFKIGKKKMMEEEGGNLQVDNQETIKIDS